MEENLSNSQAVLGNSPDAMHNAFKSDEEMLNFYLTLNRFINPVTYYMEKTVLERLNDLHQMLVIFADFTGPIGTHTYRGVDNIVKGFGSLMIRADLSAKDRYKRNELAGYHFQLLFDVAANKVYAKRLSSIYMMHIHHVNYLIRKLEAEVANSLLSTAE